jgi:tetratricopeptide (TPR) repeat protein
LERALELQRRVLGAQNPGTLNTVSHLANIASNQGKYSEAEVLSRQSLEGQRRVLGLEHPDTLRSMDNLALVYLQEGNYPQAEALHSKTLEIRRRVQGAEHPGTLASMTGLAEVYSRQGKYAQAEALHSKTLEIRRRVLGPEHPDTLDSMNTLAFVYLQEGKYAQAEALYNQTLELNRRVLGPEHPSTLASMHNLANVYNQQGKYAQAEALHSKTLEIKRRVLGPEHPSTLRSMGNLANVYNQQGKYAQAEALYSQTLEIQRRVRGPEHPNTLKTLSDFASMYQRQGKYSLAEAQAARPWRGGGTSWDRKTRIRWYRPPIWHWPTSRRGSSPRVRPSRARPLSSITRSNRMIGKDSAPRVCWAPAWLGGGDTPMANRSCSKVIRGWPCGKTGWESRTGITWIAPANGLFNSISSGESRKKRPNGGESCTGVKLLLRQTPLVLRFRHRADDSYPQISLTRRFFISKGMPGNTLSRWLGVPFALSFACVFGASLFYAGYAHRHS